MNRLLFLFLFFPVLISAQEDAYRDFDFWVGEWNVYKMGTDTLVGKSKITSILNGKAIQENYSSTRSGFEGTSLNKYNAEHNQWEQFWVDNTGLTLHIQGKLESGSMQLKNSTNWISWTPLEDGSVRQTWKIKDEKTGRWNTVFDGQYLKQQKKAAPGQ
ncbi:MAG: hypothetical protein MRY78_15430 [Saprospiraceae bacterium]|nr:hypothetical protein [Saprospiraceae bacterium]